MYTYIICIYRYYIYIYIYIYTHIYVCIYTKNQIKLLMQPNNPSVKNLIKQHNTRLTKSGANTNIEYWNCLKKNDFPLDGMYVVECIIYEATVSRTNEPNT